MTRNLPQYYRSFKGFTLVELLIVVSILAILAAVVIPQFSTSSEDANVSALKADLSAMRNAIELYYTQHNSRYPGAYSNTDGTTASTAATAPAAFIAQLTLYTDKSGRTSGTKTGAYRYGPYLRQSKLPTNPFNDRNTLQADATTDDLNVALTADGSTGWKFYVRTGKFISNDNTTLSDGTTNTNTF